MFAKFLILSALSCVALGSNLERELRELYPQSEYLRPKSVPYRSENPYSAEKAELGKVLFFDPRLSQARNQSCVSCHHPGLGWEMGIPKALGAAMMPRKSPTLLNLAWSDTWFWDGRAASLSEQFHTAMTSAKAMALSSEEMVTRLKAVKGYGPLLQKAFGSEEVTEARVANALEIFERGIVATESPFDRWLKGDENALSAAGKRGAAVFAGKAKCATCHSGWNFTDNGFHDIGLTDADLGRGARIKLTSMAHAFKTPTLREIAQRAPYMHDGSIATLEEVIEHYDAGATVSRESLAPEVVPLHLSKREKADLVEFLKALTGPVSSVEIPRMPM